MRSSIQWLECKVMGRCAEPEPAGWCPTSRWWCPDFKGGVDILPGAETAAPLCVLALMATLAALAYQFGPSIRKKAATAWTRIRQGTPTAGEQEERPAGEATVGEGDRPEHGSDTEAKDEPPAAPLRPDPIQMAGAVPVFPEEVLGPRAYQGPVTRGRNSNRD